MMKNGRRYESGTEPIRISLANLREDLAVIFRIVGKLHYLLIITSPQVAVICTCHANTPIQIFYYEVGKEPESRRDREKRVFIKISPQHANFLNRTHVKINVFLESKKAES